MRRRLTCLLLLLVLAGCTPVGGRPAGLHRLTIVTEGDHAFAPAESIAGDLVVLGGSVRVAEGTRVEGSLVLLSGVVAVGGRIDGDVWLMNGTLTLGPSASVERDVQHAGGMLEVAPEAMVGGKVARAGESAVGLLGDRPSPGPGDVLARTVTLGVLLAPLALVLAAVAGQPIRRIGRAISTQPLAALALGLLVLIVVPTLLVLMAFTIVLAPVVALLALLLGATVLYGAIGLGGMLGQWLGRALGWRALATRQPLGAPVGTFVLLLGLAAASFSPILEVLVVAVCLALGAGAVLLTGFGSRTFVPADAEFDSDPASD